MSTGSDSRVESALDELQPGRLACAQKGSGHPPSKRGERPIDTQLSCVREGPDLGARKQVDGCKKEQESHGQGNAEGSVDQ